MKHVVIEISGKFAYFSNGILNKSFNQTFEHIHFVAIRGIIGAIMGHGGFQGEEKSLEFMEKTKDLNIHIVPDYPVFNKILEKISSTTGLHQESGNVVIDERELLIEPKWTIVLSGDNELLEELEDRVKKQRFEFYPCLGKREYLAKVVLSLENPEELLKVGIKEDDEMFENIRENRFLLPVNLGEYDNQHEYKRFLVVR